MASTILPTERSAAARREGQHQRVRAWRAACPHARRCKRQSTRSANCASAVRRGSILSSVRSESAWRWVTTHHRPHWRLDVVMNEDQDKSRLENGPNNHAVLRHMTMNVMQKDGEKGSLRGKIKRAGWDEAYLARLSLPSFEMPSP
jgi:predicted transposase YbfD/YdcC